MEREMRRSGAVGMLDGKGGRLANGPEGEGEGEWSECGMLKSGSVQENEIVAELKKEEVKN